MESLCVKNSRKLEPIELNHLIGYNSPKNASVKFDALLGSTPMNYERRQVSFSNSFRKNIDNNLRQIAGKESPSMNLRHLSMMKQRDLNMPLILGKASGEISKRTTRSRLRHPKIAISKRHPDKLRAFSIHSDFDDEISIFSREGNEKDEPLRALVDDSFFRCNTNFDEGRVATPGFKNINTE